jgi:hypothetical protein
MLLFASEIASLIGRHKYQASHVGLVKVWQRIDHQSYEIAKDRQLYVVETDLELDKKIKLETKKINATLNQSNVKDIVQEQLTTPIHDANDTFKAHKLNKDTLQILADSTLEEKNEIMRALCDVSDLQLKPDVIARINIEVEKATKITEPDALQKQCDVIMSIPQKADSQKIKAQVRSLVYKHRGTANEARAISAYEQHYDCTVKLQNSIFYKTPVGLAIIGGRVDGLVGDRLVEVKCRQNRFFDTLPDYEYVQIQCYMKITGCTVCDVVQFYNNEIRVDTHEFDIDAWDRIAEAISDFATGFEIFLDSHDLQDQFMDQFIA